MVEYRIKAAMKIIIRMEKEDVFKLYDVLRSVEDLFKQNGVCFQSLDRRTAVAEVREIMDAWIKDGTLEVPARLVGSLNSFLELMVSERAQEDELLFEYNRALTPLFHYDLFDMNS